MSSDPLRKECENFARRKRCEEPGPRGSWVYDCTETTLCDRCAPLADDAEAFALRMKQEALREAADAANWSTPAVGAWVADWLRARAEEVSR